MRQIAFAPEESKDFLFLWECIHTVKRLETREEVKSFIRTKARLSKISTETNAVIAAFLSTPYPPKMRALNPEGGEVLLEDADYRFLKAMIDKIQPVPHMAEIYENICEKMDGAESVDVKVAKV